MPSSRTARPDCVDPKPTYFLCNNSLRLWLLQQLPVAGSFKVMALLVAGMQVNHARAASLTQMGGDLARAQDPPPFSRRADASGTGRH
jgi:hypothetical protein